MTRTLAAIAFVTGLIGWAGTSRAYEAVGVGAWSCAAWAEARKSVRSDTAEQWALGFLSGIGFMVQQAADPLRGVAPQSVSEWLDRYCRSNPRDTIAHATEKFSSTRQVIAAPSASEMVAAPAGNR